MNRGDFWGLDVMWLEIRRSADNKKIFSSNDREHWNLEIHSPIKGHWNLEIHSPIKGHLFYLIQNRSVSLYMIEGKIDLLYTQRGHNSNGLSVYNSYFFPKIDLFLIEDEWMNSRTYGIRFTEKVLFSQTFQEKIDIDNLDLNEMREFVFS